MWYHSILYFLKAAPAQTGTGRARRVVRRKMLAACRLQLEPLEDRSLPSSFPVLSYAAGWNGPPALVGSAHVAGLTGTWKPAASMAEARSYYTATPVDDGRVLVAGGFVRTNGIGPPRGGAYSAGAEIYDPRSDTWSPTGRLGTARAGHGAVALEDGRVLVAGGSMVVAPGLPPVTLNSAEIYDPETGVWTATGAMNVPRIEPILTLLPDGRVFIAGAARTLGPNGTSAEIYDPESGQWTRVADMSTPRNDHIQELLDDGRVLVAGGFTGTIPAPGKYLASAEIYDPDSNTWTPTGSMTVPRADPEGVVLKDGRVLATGGNTAISNPATRTNTAEIYDPATSQWRQTGGAMSDPKVDHAIALLKDGRVLVAGGIRTNETYVASADLYDPRTDTWTPVPSMSNSRGGILAVNLKHGRVLVVGGLNADPSTLPGNALASAEIFVPARMHGDGERGDGKHGDGEHGDDEHVDGERGEFHSRVFPGTRLSADAGINALGDIISDHPDVRGATRGTYRALDFPRADVTPADGIDPGDEVGNYFREASHSRHAHLAAEGIFTDALGINSRGDMLDLDGSPQSTTNGTAKG